MREAVYNEDEVQLLLFYGVVCMEWGTTFTVFSSSSSLILFLAGCCCMDR
ncbi:hypothetical protein PAXINDRAFT_18407 [Paxillus involutus ATCC 200175]|uniref:Uncharacterized protein n=1 Tax=Paxillus involutus ATCC 200175 TaxID=664439 RepID=A0A0C9SYZ7_PAXIN|nr:hypothetical protein PAXINDRAFT_18407 [Paxillus involutus ATCC 200175]